MTEYSNLLNLLGRSEEFLRLKKTSGGGEGPCSVFGVSEEAAPFLIAALTEGGKSALIVAANEREAKKLSDRLSPLCGAAVVELPPKEIQFRAFFARSREIADARIAAIDRLASGEPCVLVACAEAAMQRMAPPSAFSSTELVLRPGDTMDLDNLAEKLRRAGYERVFKVDAPGQFRISGSLFDVYPSGSETPYRVEFFGDEVDGVRAMTRPPSALWATPNPCGSPRPWKRPFLQKPWRAPWTFFPKLSAKSPRPPLRAIRGIADWRDGDVSDALLPFVRTKHPDRLPAEGRADHRRRARHRGRTRPGAARPLC